MAAVTKRAADGLDEFLDVVAERGAETEVARFDQPACAWPANCTGCTAPAPTATPLITCHRGRGQDGIDDAGVLTRFRGVAVHDAWAPYDT